MSTFHSFIARFNLKPPKEESSAKLVSKETLQKIIESAFSSRDDCVANYHELNLENVSKMKNYTNSFDVRHGTHFWKFSTFTQYLMLL